MHISCIACIAIIPLSVPHLKDMDAHLQHRFEFASASDQWIFKYRTQFQFTNSQEIYHDHFAFNPWTHSVIGCNFVPRW
jgi:hypothetical protein